jgi:hypothetical protein
MEEEKEDLPHPLFISPDETGIAGEKRGKKRSMMSAFLQ